ncbi:hypothetical protein TKK_0007959 [Trichogramma kaykai]
MAIQRFATRRGFPLILCSDNETNFKAADKELKAQLNQLNSDRQAQFALQNRFLWRFNPPAAPHMGGSWERLVRSVKTALKFTLKERCPLETFVDGVG